MSVLIVTKQQKDMNYGTLSHNTEVVEHSVARCWNSIDRLVANWLLKKVISFLLWGGTD